MAPSIPASISISACPSRARPTTASQVGRSQLGSRFMGETVASRAHHVPLGDGSSRRYSVYVEARRCDSPSVTDPFSSLLSRATADPRVLGLIVGGSRGKGFQTANSDWDVYVVTSNAAQPSEVRDGLGTSGGARIDLCAVLTVDDFAAHALPGEAEEWNAYNFAHLTPTLDRTGGLLQRLCDEKEWLPEDVAHARAGAHLDGYINSYYRSLKNERDGNVVASRLDAAESVACLLGFVFTAERRVRPYNKFLAWELDRHPVSVDWWVVSDPMATVMKVVATGDLQAQAAIFTGIERRARILGLGDVLDAWGSSTLAAMARGSSHE